jgi:hypothetical protein
MRSTVISTALLFCALTTPALSQIPPDSATQNFPGDSSWGAIAACGGVGEPDCGTCSDYSVGGVVVSYGGQCTPEPKSKGYANVDMDSIGTDVDDEGFTTGQAISIVFATKQQHEDSDRKVHGATSTYDAALDGTDAKYNTAMHGVPLPYEKSNGRYFLPCKQAAGEKTIKITVFRDASLTEFGGEWVKLYEKDSWKNVTNEYEPYTFNDFGTKIPLQEFRPTTIDGDGRTIVNNAANTAEVNVFMVMDQDGDYEVRYANPKLKTSTGKWISFEFKRHQIRIGDPWTDCSVGDTGTGADTGTTVGTIVPVYLGNPALLIAEYTNVETILSAAFTGDAAAVPTKIILPIFSPGNDGADKTVDPGSGGTTWTEGYVATVADRGDRNPLTSKNEAYHCDSSWQENDPVAPPACQKKTYHKCYRGGSVCPLDHAVCKVEYCEMQRWRQIVDLYHTMTNVEVLGLIETKNVDGTERTDAEIEADIAKYTTHVTGVKGFYFNNAHGSKSVVDGLIDIAHAEIPSSMTTVFGIGQPLLDKAALDRAGAPDVWVTLNTEKDSAGDRLGGDLGSWTPFSWYPYIAATKWSAVVTEVDSADISSTLAMMLDRGYGYVYLHSAELFSTTSTHLTELITAIGGTRRLEATERKLQTLDNGVSKTRYECDDTLFECEPVCVETVGLVRNKVSDSQCSAEQKLDACSCNCYHHTQWTCEGNKVVCKASLRDGGLQTVGDLVCETRGTPKPAWDANPERFAAECTELPTLRDDKPTEQCMAKYREQAAGETMPTMPALLAPEDFDLTMGAMGGAVQTAMAVALALNL